MTLPQTSSVPIPAPAGTQAAAEVRQGVSRLSRRLRGGRPVDGIGLTALSVLSQLYRTGTSTPSMLASAERLQPQSLTRVLAELSDRSLISRRPDPEDGRQTLIDLTPEGLDVLSRDARGREAWLADAMAATLTETEIEVLRLAAQLMDRLADA